MDTRTAGQEIILTRPDLRQSQNRTFNTEVHEAGRQIQGSSLARSSFLIPRPNLQDNKIDNDLPRGLIIQNRQITRDEFEAKQDRLRNKIITADDILNYGLDRGMPGQRFTEAQAAKSACREVFAEAMNMPLGDQIENVRFEEIYGAYTQELQHIALRTLSTAFMDFAQAYPFYRGVLHLQKVRKAVSNTGRLYREANSIQFEIVLNLSDEYNFQAGTEEYFNIEGSVRLNYSLVEIALDHNDRPIQDSRKGKPDSRIVKQFKLNHIAVSGPDSALVTYCIMNTMQNPMARNNLACYFESGDESVLRDANGKILIVKSKAEPEVEPVAWLKRWKLKLSIAAVIIAVIVPVLIFFTSYIETYGVPTAAGIIGGAGLIFGSMPFCLDLAVGVARLGRLISAKCRPTTHMPEASPVRPEIRSPHPLSGRSLGDKPRNQPYFPPVSEASAGPDESPMVIAVPTIANFDPSTVTSPVARTEAGMTPGGHSIRGAAPRADAISPAGSTASGTPTVRRLRDSMAEAMKNSPRRHAPGSPLAAQRGSLLGTPLQSRAFAPPITTPRANPAYVLQPAVLFPVPEDDRAASVVNGMRSPNPLHQESSSARCGSARPLLENERADSTGMLNPLMAANNYGSGIAGGSWARTSLVIFPKGDDTASEHPSTVQVASVLASPEKAQPPSGSVAVVVTNPAARPPRPSRLPAQAV